MSSYRYGQNVTLPKRLWTETAAIKTAARAGAR